MEMNEFEARKERRIISVYRTCYVGTDDKVQFALLRNVSEGGAQIEADIEAPIGTTVYYSLDEGTRIEAEIRWKKDGRIGLENRSLRRLREEAFPRRAIRLPMRHEGDAWVDGKPYKVRISNISQLGARLIGLPPVTVGKPIVLKIGAIEIHSVTARWVGDLATGVRFPRALSISDLNEILGVEAGSDGVHPDAPERVLELEQWGALFDRTPDGAILQRAFGGHTCKRLCHVGDRTGLEMIRTLQDYTVHLGVDVHMETTVIELPRGEGQAELRVVETEWGGVPARIASIADVSARKSLERARDRMLARGFSGEARTALTTIIGLAELMLAGKSGPSLHPRHAEYLNDIRESGEALLALLRSLGETGEARKTAPSFG